MNARELMTSPAVTAGPDATVAELARVMLDGNLAGVPVVEPDGTLIGLVTVDDLVAKHARVHVPAYLGILGGVLPFRRRDFDDEMRRALGVTARDLMEEEFPIAETGASLDDLATLMVDQNVETLPVVENGRVVGTVSRADILRLLIVEEQDDARDAI